MKKINLMIVDDQPIVRDGLKMILGLSNDIDVKFCAGNGKEALEKLKELEIEVILMDVRMPVLDGVKATKLIKEKYPGIKIIILTTFDDDELIFDSLKNGASSYLLKDIPSEELINSIKIIYMGGSIFNCSIASKIVERGKKESKKDEVKLTKRELEVAGLISDGLSNREISKKLYITEGTVKNHVTNILSKLSLKHRTHIALYVIENYK